MVAPRFSACSKLSSTNIPDPSPITNPFRSLSNGIEARVGSSVVERAVRAWKPAIANGVIEASEPPTNIKSWKPNLMARKASPIASLEEAQAVLIDLQIPLAPKRIATLPDAIFGRAFGRVIGLTRFGPFSCKRIT